MADNILKSKLDANQVIRKSYDEAAEALKVIPAGGVLVPDTYTSIELTYIASGNGTGEIGTVTYYNDVTQVALLTLGYDSSNRLISVVRS